MAGGSVTDALTSYATAFDRFTSRLPAAQRPARRVLLDAFLQRGFPHRKQEDWRYTDLSMLADQTFEPAATAASELQALFLPRTDRLVYINGVLDKAQSGADELSGLVEPDQTAALDSMTALNAAFALPGLDLRLGARATIARVLHVIVASQPGARAGMSHQRHRIELGETAEATVIFEFLGGDGTARLMTHMLDIRLAAGAKLRLYRVQNEGAGTTLLTRIDARLGRNSRLEATCIDGGRGLTRHDLNIEIAEDGAETEIDGLYVPATGAHIDNHTRIVHTGLHGRSRERFKGIVDARTRAVFNGKVIVRPGAQKTDSEQHVANLLLSPRAEVNAKPELEIYADDVKCAHGATVGQLDANALSYLRSRGIDAEIARAMLLHAFAVEVLDRIDVPALRSRVERQLALPAADLVAEELPA